MDKYKRLLELEQDPLTDKAYLERFIINNYRFHNGEIWQLKDNNLVCMGVSSVFATTLCFTSSDAMVGKKYSEIPCKVAEIADVFYAQDREVEKAKCSKSFLDIHEYYSGISVLKGSKTPVINPSTQNVLGIICQSSSYLINSTLKFIIDIHKNRYNEDLSYRISDQLTEYNLSPTELEVLSCICLGYTEKKSIAQFLSMVYKSDIKAETTVNDAIRRLCQKLNVIMLHNY